MVPGYGLRQRVYEAQGLDELLVRHLVVSGSLEDGAGIFPFLASAVSCDTCINVTDQCLPVDEKRCPELRHRPRSAELRQAQALAEAAGLWRFDSRRR